MMIDDARGKKTTPRLDRDTLREYDCTWSSSEGVGKVGLNSSFIRGNDILRLPFLSWHNRRRETEEIFFFKKSKESERHKQLSNSMKSDKESTRELDEESNLRRRKPRRRTVRTSNRLYLAFVGYSLCYISNDSENSIRSPRNMDTTPYFHKWPKFLGQPIGQKCVIKRPGIWNNRTQHRLCSSILQYLSCFLKFFSGLIDDLSEVYYCISSESQCREERIADTESESENITRKTLAEC